MKKLFALIAILSIFVFGMSVNVVAQDQTEAAATEEVTEAADSVAQATDSIVDLTADPVEEAAVAAEEGKSLHSQLKQKFIEGGPTFMSFVLIALILGLALAIERIIYLNLATTNTKRLLTKVEEALNNGGVEAAKEVCRNTRGPVASIFYQGLDRYDEGVDVVEKSVVSYGSVQAGLLEKGLSWIALFIALAPMLGFLGTVIGMIQAFDAIEVAGDISPALVAGGIKVALITTVTGLVVAMILQIFYNYCVSKIDSIINSMEDASISLLDMVVKFTAKK
ncbi:MAG TPA: MotA/TolQ/ExbB proton channel family protein [Prolixibacteraceae bacterium]|nr:MotA/TolQ/ExbB proton channel family protein [Prolixibacteraceae bacterium]HPR61696.1 MotA/TolQ/ExbB proton channel family protein [Prolixibacteraceae bacterium]